MRQDRKKTDDRAQADGGLFRFCDARAVCWWLVIPVAIIVVLLVRVHASTDTIVPRECLQAFNNQRLHTQ